MIEARWPRAAAAAFGIAVFFAIGGATIIDPTRTGWIGPGSDWGYHYVGWRFFRQSSWQLFPLGAIPDMLYPVGTTVGFNDGIPWLALVAKLLSPVLPDSFQYMGLWLLLCFALQGWFGARLAQALAPRVAPVTAALAGALFAAAPVVIHRVMHEALCAHFLLLWAMAMAVRRPARAPRAAPALLTALSMGIHPYLAVMVAALAAAAVLRCWLFDKVSGPAAALAQLALVGVAFVGMGLLFGYIGPAESDLAGRGFGYYTSDLLVFLNPGGHSRVIPTLFGRQGVREEFGYLGLGALALGATAVVLAVVARVRREPPLPWRKAAPMVVAVALLLLYAASPKVSAYGRPLVDLSPLYGHLAFLTGPFRAAGRFLWPSIYLLMAGALGVWLRRRPRVAPYALAAALALQLADMKDFLFVARFGHDRPQPARAPAWQLARGDYDHMELYPPRCGDGSFPCCAGFTPPPRPDDMYLAILATRLGVTLNSGGVARAFRTRLVAYCAELQDAVTHGRLDARTIYIVGRGKEQEFRAANPGAPCAKLDGELTCVAPGATGKLRDLLVSAHQ